MEIWLKRLGRSNKKKITCQLYNISKDFTFECSFGLEKAYRIKALIAVTVKKLLYLSSRNFSVEDESGFVYNVYI